MKPAADAQRSRLLARSLIGLGLGLAAAAVVFVVLDPGGDDATVQFGSAGTFGALLYILPVASFFAVGSLLTLRRTENVVGWLSLTIGLIWIVTLATSAAGLWAFNSDLIGLAEWLGVFGAAWVPALGLIATHLPLRLPDGELPSPRWRWFSRFCTAVIVVVAVAIGTAPGPVNGIPGTENPLAYDPLQVLSPAFALLPFCFVGAVASLVLRYRRSGGTERLQIRVIAFGGAIFVLMFVVSLAPLVGLIPEGTGTEQLLQNLVLVLYNAIPVAIASAVFRYRLFDIDVVINRALVYGALTATLASTYVSGVLLLQFALRPLTDSSELAVAGSTLAVAALFRPARTRIRAWVDRRFYRSRYDAGQTLASFTGRLREQLDLDALSADVRGVVRQTVQPVHVSLWLRETR